MRLNVRGGSISADWLQLRSRAVYPNPVIRKSERALRRDRRHMAVNAVDACLTMVYSIRSRAFRSRPSIPSAKYISIPEISPRAFVRRNVEFRCVISGPMKTIFLCMLPLHLACNDTLRSIRGRCQGSLFSINSAGHFIRPIKCRESSLLVLMQSAGS